MLDALYRTATKEEMLGIVRAWLTRTNARLKKEVQMKAS